METTSEDNIYTGFRGRTTQNQKRALIKYKDVFSIDDWSMIESIATSGSHLSIGLEIGFGMGSSLIDMARKESKTNFLGIEVHKPGIGKTLNDVELYAIKNLKLICHDATEVFQNAFKNKSLDRVLIYFPDPWPKKRHAKRRLIQTEFATIISEKLKIGGHLHLSTDWRPYADHMVSVLEKVPHLKNAIAQNSFWENPKRPETKFERRGKTLGNKIWDLLYEKE